LVREIGRGRDVEERGLEMTEVSREGGRRWWRHNGFGRHSPPCGRRVLVLVPSLFYGRHCCGRHRPSCGRRGLWPLSLYPAWVL